MTATNNKLISLYEAMLNLKTSQEIESFFKDLCTPAELKAFHERWAVAQLLDKGELSYRRINEQTGTSTTTVSRVARFLTQEKNSGYRLILDKIKKNAPQEKSI